MRKKLEKRLSYLYTGETMSLILFIFISYLLNYTFPQMHLYSLLSFWTSFLLLEFLLVQGAVYWFVKWMRLRSENTSITPIRIVQKLRSLKKINVGFIIILPGAFIADYVKWQP
ncbi:hypothetical protein DFO73_106101 [Cytobacillus oceanisediminis]|uniref:Uncharacterized protein n=1 Tax=Cytobacillus oceanisediminis TaxID=665099 RepID=A0A2V2ZW58_9BACI|nr:hypothetical protein DFO73_106101 [Cytobacillus oceanisediminis]